MHSSGYQPKLIGYFWILLIGYSDTMHLPDPGICSSIDARNDVTNLTSLQDCTVVEGSVQIVLMEKMREEDFENYSFPKLREITHYLLLFRVGGLRSLGKLFPNLEKIGGVEQIEFFSLIVYEMFSLQEIGLLNLREITMGSVMINKNQKLCFVNTVQWDKITKWNSDLNKLQNQAFCSTCPVNCPRCPDRCPFACWNSTVCQGKWKSPNCSPMCLGDCDPNDPQKCYTCKGVFDLDQKCASTCPENTYQYFNRRCVTRKDCTATRVPTQSNEVNISTRYYVIHENQCVSSCPGGVDPTVMGLCPPCEGGKCPKVCNGAKISSIAEALRLQNCTYIRGSIEITIKASMSDEVHKLLEESLGSIEQITGHLQIKRSSLVDLNFLKNLSVIHGIDPYNEYHSLYVTHNENLQELWDWKEKKNLKILKGKLLFNSNPKLCLDRIKKLVKVIRFNETDSIFDKSNGNDFQCSPIETNITARDVTSESIRVHVHCTETLPVFRYVVYYIKDVFKNVTIFNSFTQCSDDGWRTKDVSVDSNGFQRSKGIDIVLTNLEPATTYVFYVIAYTMYNNVTRSDMHRRTTLPTTPSEVVGLRALVKSHTEIELSWQPPRRTNGKLKEYVVTWYELSENKGYILQRDYCENPMLPGLEDFEEGDLKMLDKNDGVNNTDSNNCCESQPTLPKDEFEMLCGECTNLPISTPGSSKHPSCKSFFYAHIYNSRFIQESSDFLIIHFDLKTNHSEHMGAKLGLKKLSTNKNQIVTDNRKSNKYLEMFKEREKNKINHSVKRLHPKSINLVLKDLKSFQNYVIYLKACRELHESELENDSSEDYRCSISEMITVRTKGKTELDAIPYYDVLPDMNNGKIVKWAPPKNPNGLVVAFELEYRHRDLENGSVEYMKTKCITYSQYIENSNQHVIEGFPAGKYYVRIRAISLFGKGPYTEPVPFEVYEIENQHSSRPIFLYVLAFCLVSLTVIVIFFVISTISNRKKGSWDTEFDLNPPPYKPDHYEIDREDVELGKELGTGSFGKVYEGLWKSKNLRCAIKTVNQDATTAEEREFLFETSVMKNMVDAHFIVKIYAVVSNKSPPLALMELMELGDLKTYLREMRETPVSIATMIKMALEIADGMAYMEAHKYVHRDLAARNCMVNADLTVKVGDFGMSRDIYITDYYRRSSYKCFLPVRWMAPESIWDGVFTSHSDIWSYGVVLWEIVTMAEQPYQGSSNDEVTREVVGGRTLDIPKTSPVPLKLLMTTCWKNKPSSRTSFMNIVGNLKYYHDEEFRNVAFYYTEKAVAARIATSEYVDMQPVDPSSTSCRLATVDEETT
ncbi:insulin-like growth factor 1 receptor [Macrosteles quadrilineatus]|uniref:insulin-like growth factor 1 receptor n=1 Tax=Macrosteles quadrilineatus TaxID=74068 RepID=UPI0023E2535E|nr:insulin-like growth factor 1 receptor [Macrosteles quadrilineatus]